MKIADILEHSDWKPDPFYTKDRIRRIHMAISAVQNVASTKGIVLDVRDHFYKQLLANRGMSRIDENMLMETFGRIINRGLHLFKDKADGTNLVFYDPHTNLNIPFTKVTSGVFRLPTIVRDLRWLGPEQKVTLN